MVRLERLNLRLRAVAKKKVANKAANHHVAEHPECITSEKLSDVIPTELKSQEPAIGTHLPTQDALTLLSDFVEEKNEEHFIDSNNKENLLKQQGR